MEDGGILFFPSPCSIVGGVEDGILFFPSPGRRSSQKINSVSAAAKNRCAIPTSGIFLRPLLPSSFPFVEDVAPCDPVPVLPGPYPSTLTVDNSDLAAQRFPLHLLGC